jgi:hypothetical protein
VQPARADGRAPHEGPEDPGAGLNGLVPTGASSCPPRSARTITAMFAAEVWHYWIAVPLTVGAVLASVSLVANYFRKVQAVKYPKKR